MTLEALLNYLRKNRLRDTARNVVGGDDPRLWDDESLVTNINEACQEFAKRTLCLKATTTFETVVDQKLYPQTDNIIAVQSMRFKGNGSWVGGVYTLNAGLDPSTELVYPDQVDLQRSGHSMLEGTHQPDTFMFDVNRMDRLPPGKPYLYGLDETITDDTTGVSGVSNIRLYPICSPKYANCVVAMRYEKMPTELTVDDMDVEPEIPREYHRQLLDYAAYLALDIVDNEMGDLQRAQNYLATFKDNCEKARREILRKTFTPMNWGFGRNAYSYIGN